MRLRPPARARNEDERILPLINIVFLLLIFFMVAGRLSGGDPFAVEPPESVSRAAADAQEPMVLMSADGRLALDGAVMTAPALKEALAERMRSAEHTVVRLKADGRTEAARVVAIMELLREAGVTKIELLTLEARP